MKGEIMKRRNVTILRFGTLALLALLICPGLSAKSGDWKEGTAGKKSIQVKYRISDEKDASGQKTLLIEYIAHTTVEIDFEECLEVMRDPVRLKEIMGAETSEVVRNITDDEWLMYFFYPSFGPINAADAVMNCRYSEKNNGKTAEFLFTAVPEQMEDKGMPRVMESEETYEFRDLGNGQVEIQVSIRTAPAVDVPKWMLKMAFPDAAGDTILKIVSLVEEG